MLRKITFGINALLVVTVLAGFVLASRKTHTVDLVLLQGVIPTLVLFISLSNPSSRLMGGIAALINGILVIGASFLVFFSFFNPLNANSLVGKIGFFLVAVYLFLVGYLNSRLIWALFPPKSKKGMTNSKEAESKPRIEPS